MLEMRAVYGAEGYGWYWMIIEMMREQSDFKLELCKRNALAMHLQCDPDAAHKFVQDCINEFNLFDADDEFFWSNSLLRRMNMRMEKSEKARKAALKRWGKDESCERNANAMLTQCDRNAIKGKERKGKVKEKKEKESKTAYADYVKLTPEEHQKLIDQFGQAATNRMIEILDNYKGANGKTYKSDYRAILNWVADRYQEETAKTARGDPLSDWAEKRKNLRQVSADDRG